jgi:ribose/xylose/arabinose/galactoside ABC-type transport system permease subunit
MTEKKVSKQVLVALNEPLNVYEMHVLGYLNMKGGRQAGSFTNALIGAIFAADLQNTAILHSVYPELVEAVNGWRSGNLAERSGNEE